MMPSLFIAHGSPTLAIEDNEYTQFLSQFAQTLGRPSGIVIFSAHWEAQNQMVSEVVEYPMIYDFGGFPAEMYRIQYPANGDLNLSREIEELFAEQDIPFQVEHQRGLDHGAWVVLRLLYPNADIPVIAMSVNPNLSLEEQYRIGKALSSLRSKDVLIIGSGGTVHNLRAINFAGKPGQADEWALAFDEWIANQLTKWDLASLFDYRSLAPFVQYAVPSWGTEHFIPLIYAMGAADDARTAQLLHRSFQYGNLSQSVWQFGS